MPPIALNRRRFLGCSAAAGLALSQGRVADASETLPVRIGVVGAGTRGTSLLRTLLELPGVKVTAVADPEPKHAVRAQGIVEKATGARPEAIVDVPSRLVERDDVDAVVVAVPCDRHLEHTSSAIRHGKHVYTEKPLALTLADCDRLIAESADTGLAVHVGFQRRSNPRYREGVERVRRGELGALIELSATWISSNGPMNGHDDWLARRARSGDWMVEQAVHVWDVFHWVAGGPPVRAYGHGRRGLFARQQPGRDVTDHYSVQLEWADGLQANFLQSWVAPADDRFTGTTLQVMGTEGGLDFATGALTFRDKGRPRQVLHPGVQPDTRLALQAFVTSVRSSGQAAPPLTLKEARDATLIGLLVRRAVDERRVVTLDEIRAEPSLA